MRVTSSLGVQCTSSVIGVALASSSDWLIRNRPSRATAYWAGSLRDPAARDAMRKQRHRSAGLECRTRAASAPPSSSRRGPVEVDLLAVGAPARRWRRHRSRSAILPPGVGNGRIYDFDSARSRSSCRPPSARPETIYRLRFVERNVATTRGVTLADRSSPGPRSSPVLEAPRMTRDTGRPCDQSCRSCCRSFEQAAPRADPLEASDRVRDVRRSVGRERDPAPVRRPDGTLSAPASKVSRVRPPRTRSSSQMSKLPCTVREIATRRPSGDSAG